EARSASDLIKIVWRRLCEPREQRQFQLLFELAAARGRGSTETADLARSLVNDWLDLITDQLTRDGWSPEDASVLATALLAQVRGLQLDLLLSGDRTRADRALDAVLRLVEPPRNGRRSTA